MTLSIRLTLRVLALCAAATLVVLQSAGPIPARAQSPPADRGAVALAKLLGRLQTTASLLHTAAHPDDENTGLIARMAHGEHARVAYLSVTRGEGGQNALGPELGEALGVIRTEELLQARRLDGGSQFFTRAFDYGFSKRLEEAIQLWGEREVLADAVRVIRMYRPLVVASQFSGTGGDGHGQHQFAGYITPLAFRAAADPKQFPEQLAEGLRPWQPRKLYVSGGFRPSAADASLMPVEVGVYDPLLGRTYYEIGAEGRSQHRSQEMGSLQLRGPQTTRWRLVESTVKSGGAQEMFAGLDVSVPGIEKLVGLPEAVITSELAQIDSAVRRAVAEFDVFRPAEILEHLAAGLRLTRAARTRLARGVKNDGAFADADFLLAHKEREFQEAMQISAGVLLDAVADAETVAPGDSLLVTVRLFAPDPDSVAVQQYELLAPKGWRTEETRDPPTAPPQRFRRAESTPHVRSYTVTVAEDAPPTTPYFLERPRDGFLYDWPPEAPQGQPFAPALLHARVRLQVNGVSFEVIQPVRFRIADDIRGELRPAVNVVPAITISLDPPLLMADVSAPGSHAFTTRTCSYSGRRLEGQVRLAVPDAWQVQPRSSALVLPAKGECRTTAFEVTIPAGTPAGDYRVAAEAQFGDEVYGLTQQTVSYPHIDTHRLYSAARADVHVLPLQVAPVRVGYIMGSGDQVPEAIRRLGLEVTMLGERDLAIGDLSRYDTIVVGIKAANVRPDFIANHQRLLEFMRRGGTLIVQFQQGPYIQNRMPPYPAQIDNFSAGRARVSDETAPVTVLAPDHPVFNFPNRITPADWQGWVQERSLYNFTQWAPEYVPLLQSADPGEPPQRGGQVYARVGKGHYVYSSYSWFRQLPAGVPGAYRLFANLLSLPRAPERSVSGEKE